MHRIYVLLSQKNGKQYIGYTQKEPANRLYEHNHGSNAWTKQNGPFDLIYSETFSSRKTALKQETYLKSAEGRRFLKKETGGHSLA